MALDTVGRSCAAKSKIGIDVMMFLERSKELIRLQCTDLHPAYVEGSVYFNPADEEVL